MKQIIFITTRNLIPSDSGDKILSTSVLKKLSEKYKVILINQLDDIVNQDEYIKKVSNFAQEVHLIEKSSVSLTNTLLNTLRLYPFMIAKRRTASQKKKVMALLDKSAVDSIVIWDHLRSTALLSKSGVICNSFLLEHNNELKIIENMITGAPGYLKILLLIQKTLMKKYLKKLYDNMDHVLFISKHDIDEKNNCPKFQLLEKLPIEFEYPKKVMPIANPKRLLFVGSLDWYPNVNGLLWFVKSVWPKLNHLDIELHIVGRNPVKKITDLISQNIYVHQNVPSVKEYYLDSDIFIAPIFDGAGINIKILEALAFNIPIVLTEFATRGYNDLGFLQPTNDTSLYAIQIEKLLKDKYFYQNIMIAEEKYYNQYITDSSSELYKRLGLQ